VSAAAHDHRALMAAAIERDGAAQRALFEGDGDAARAAFAEAAELYRRSWESAPPGSYGRLVGMLKSAVLAGGGSAEGAYVREALADLDEPSPTAAYALAIAALIAGDDAGVPRFSGPMRGGSDAFVRTADAIDALAAGGREEAYAVALEAIVHDFEQRGEHLTGVPIADTALMLERLAEPRGMPARIGSPVLPAV
jgi:hypothetical protein